MTWRMVSQGFWIIEVLRIDSRTGGIKKPARFFTVKRTCSVPAPREAAARLGLRKGSCFI